MNQGETLCVLEHCLGPLNLSNSSPEAARFSPFCSGSTIPWPISQYAAVMMQFTDRAADFLAASMTWEISPRMESYWASKWPLGLFVLFAMGPHLLLCFCLSECGCCFQASTPP